jgi:hypothetical protein
VRKFLAAFVTVMVLLSAVASAADAKGKPPAKADDKDPLAKFSDENLVDIAFCFTKFCESVAAKDAKTAAAFVSDMPRGLAQLDLNKDADKATFLKGLSQYEGCQVIKSVRLPGGVGEVTYTTKSGKEASMRMQNVGGRWKLAGL